ncbi:lytic murein transglycosylase [Klebsiella pneumoniae]|nr:lytic murein transglycosylase [Klebsiella pneumoniae]
MPPEIIVGIIGVETRWGRVMGRNPALDAPGDAVVYTRAAPNTSRPGLETFPAGGAQRSDDPLDHEGSFAGAMGYNLVMPSSYKYAVDLTVTDTCQPVGPGGCYRQRDGRFKQHGWVRRRSGGGAGAGGEPRGWRNISRLNTAFRSWRPGADPDPAAG